jgi:hypothetical protein
VLFSAGKQRRIIIPMTIALRCHEAGCVNTVRQPATHCSKLVLRLLKEKFKCRCVRKCWGTWRWHVEVQLGGWRRGGVEHSGVTSAHARSPPIGAAEGSLLKGSLNSHNTSQPLLIILQRDALRPGLSGANCNISQLQSSTISTNCWFCAHIRRDSHSPP